MTTTPFKSAVLAALLVWPVPAFADFQGFVRGLWPQAQARGVPKPLFDSAFRGMTPDPKVIELTRKQPEFRSTSTQYIVRRVSALRVEKGQAKAREWDDVLGHIEASFGVDRHVVLSVWGNETNFGGYLGGHNVLQALATLAYHGYRADYFRKELLHALDILAKGHTTPENMVGSWAGAMGHTQFMPSSFKAYAVDVTGDGRRDIWTTIPDALASTANYLKVHGWRPGETWGYEVVLPAGFSAKKGATATLAEWTRRGVRRPNGQNFPRPGDNARLFLPAGPHGPAFLTLHNFRVIKRYNNSDNYALAVGMLADRIRGGGPLATPWPLDQIMSQKEREEVQQLLNAKGFNAGPVDGKFGPQTRDAIRAFQAATDTAVDGNYTPDVLDRLRAHR